MRTCTERQRSEVFTTEVLYFSPLLSGHLYSVGFIHDGSIVDAFRTLSGRLWNKITFFYRSFVISLFCGTCMKRSFPVGIR